MTFDGLSPKYKFSAKYFSVSGQVGPLVIMYQGMMTDPFFFSNSVSATVCSLVILFAWFEYRPTQQSEQVGRKMELVVFAVEDHCCPAD